MSTANDNQQIDLILQGLTHLSFCVVFISGLIFETGILWRALAALEIMLSSNVKRSTCLCLPSVGLKALCLAQNTIYTILSTDVSIKNIVEYIILENSVHSISRHGHTGQWALNCSLHTIFSSCKDSGNLCLYLIMTMPQCKINFCRCKLKMLVTDIMNNDSVLHSQHKDEMC